MAEPCMWRRQWSVWLELPCHLPGVWPWANHLTSPGLLASSISSVYVLITLSEIVLCNFCLIIWPERTCTSELYSFSKHLIYSLKRNQETAGKPPKRTSCGVISLYSHCQLFDSSHLHPHLTLSQCPNSLHRIKHSQALVSLLQGLLIILRKEARLSLWLIRGYKSSLYCLLNSSHSCLLFSRHQQH